MQGTRLEIGLLWWCLGLLCRFLGLSQAVSGIALCAMPFFATGFIHLDGFMDVTDAVGSCRDLAKRREILKDSHVGSFAVIGVVLLILCQFAFCVSFNQKTDIRVLIVIPVVSRCGSPASQDVHQPVRTQAGEGSGYLDSLRVSGGGAGLCLFAALPLRDGPSGAGCGLWAGAAQGLPLPGGHERRYFRLCPDSFGAFRPWGVGDFVRRQV